MRTLVHAAFLAGLIVPLVGFATGAGAADLDYTYEPRPAPVLPPPPPPPCGVYRPCLRPWARAGYWGPRPWRAPWRYGYARPYPRVGYDHYGYALPYRDLPRDSYRGPRERFGDGRPYPELRDQDSFGPRGPRYDRYDHYGDDERRREDERFDRGPRDSEAGPYGRG